MNTNIHVLCRRGQFKLGCLHWGVYTSEHCGGRVTGLGNLMQICFLRFNISSWGFVNLFKPSQDDKEY